MENPSATITEDECGRGLAISDPKVMWKVVGAAVLRSEEQRGSRQNGLWSFLREDKF